MYILMTLLDQAESFRSNFPHKKITPDGCLRLRRRQKGPQQPWRRTDLTPSYLWLRMNRKVWRRVRDQRYGHHNQPSETRCQSDNTATDPGLGTTLSPPACHLLHFSLTPARCIKAFLFARKTPHPLGAFSDSFLAAGVGLLLLGPHSH